MLKSTSITLTVVALLLCAACGSTPEGTPATPDGEAAVSYDFESPKLEGEGAAPAGIRVEGGTAKVIKLATADKPSNVDVGDQVLRIDAAAGVTVRLEDLAIARPGEDWEVSFVVGVPAGAATKDFEAGLAGEFVDFVFIDSTHNDGALPAAGQFKKVTAKGSFQGGDQRVLRLSIDANGPLYLDQLSVTRRPAAGAPARLPFARKLLNSSFEQQDLGSGAFWTTVPGWTSSGTFVASFNPVAPTHWVAKPLAAPGDGKNLLELGGTSATAAHESTAKSSVFALAEKGKKYGFNFGVGHRVDLPACRDIHVTISTPSATLASTTIDASTLPAGSLSAATISTAAIEDAAVGQELTLGLRVGDSQAGLSQPCRIEFDAFNASP